ncbi:MAG: nucleoside deaminase [Sterolibacteriaceae bacterium MAG5]|nr:nucleoside deaminase [Candidatus Nitricoxidireducens bremensis]
MSAALHLEIPAWLAAVAASQPPLADDGARMAFVIGLARRNAAAGGGPFAAAVFESAGGRLVAAGVNRVVEAACSAAHAEILALSLAQQGLGCHDLGASGLPVHELVSSAEPCAMCLGAVVWSGVRRVVCAARDEDVRAIGFDEGPKPEDWVAVLAARGIAVRRDVLRAEAIAVLREYAAGGGDIYNGRRGGA